MNPSDWHLHLRAHPHISIHSHMDLYLQNHIRHMRIFGNYVTSTSLVKLQMRTLCDDAVLPIC